ncbi:MAG: hypothetical protein IJG16_13490 [Clostridia bacterium]|nr:hypothetical protein [Clostridia bacterium]
MYNKPLQVLHIQTFTTDYDYKRRERRVAFRQGENREVSATIYIQPPEINTTSNINFIIADNEGNTVKQDLLENITFEKNQRSITLDFNISGYSKGIYHIKVSIGNGAFSTAVIIIGQPESFKAILSENNAALCAKIAQSLCSYYEPCSDTIYQFGENQPPVKKEQNIRKHIGIPHNIPIYIFADATITHSAKKGIAICQDGIHIHNGVFLNWYQFIMTDIHILGPLNIGNKDVYIYGAEDITFADLLGYIQREIINSINLQNNVRSVDRTT